MRGQGRRVTALGRHLFPSGGARILNTFDPGEHENIFGGAIYIFDSGARGAVCFGVAPWALGRGASPFPLLAPPLLFPPSFLHRGTVNLGPLGPTFDLGWHGAPQALLSSSH
jgi:hypothetical protein